MARPRWRSWCQEIPVRCNRRERPTDRTRSRWSDAVPVGAAAGDAVTGTVAELVSSMHQVGRQGWTVAIGLAAGSGVHLRRLSGAG